jgi:RHS repeat-associated protein
LGRDAGFGLDGGYQADYSYDSLGRFSSVSNNVGAVPRTATYSYLPGSDLIAGYDIAVGSNTFSARKAYESNRNLITAVSNLWDSTPVSVYDYSNDALARRTKRVDNSSVTNDFGYNVRSELISALMGTNVFGYAYDPIGNRTLATNNTEVLTYLSNQLNQYTNVADGVTNTPTYDADGNLTNCNAWAFTWDGENRLIGVASNGTTVAAYSYDYMGRRWCSVRSQSGVTTTNIFTYDGWAMIRETISNDQSPMTNDFFYGPDLSGSMQGAGTIGGILGADLNGTTAFYCYDANGNATDLVDTNGTTVAHYEYDPFGKIIRSTGDTATDNPFRFSTKYTDDETGLVYYGFRYYSAELGRWLSRDPIAPGAQGIAGCAGQLMVRPFFEEIG